MDGLDVAGAHIWAESTGSGTKTPLILVHSGVATARMWEPILPALSEGRRVVAYDSRGFGRTSFDATPFADVDDLIAVLDAADIASAIVVGASRGGTVAIDAVLAHPSRFRGLVTIGSSPSGFPEPPLTDAEQDVSDRLDDLLRRGDHAAFNRLQAELWAAGTTRTLEDLDPGFLELSSALYAENLSHAGRVINRDAPDRVAVGHLSECAVPSLIVVGEHDLTPELVAADYLAAELPEATLIRLPDTAHSPSVEHPSEFLRVFGRWLADNDL